MASTAKTLHREPWNKGKIGGRKAPFKVKDIWALRVRLQMEGRARELALFDLGIDSKLRGCDLVKLKVRDVCHGDLAASRALVMQQKTKRPVQFEITQPTRDADLVRRTWPDSDPANAFHAGPRMHKLEGIVRSETITFEFDIARADFFGDYWWHDSSEDDEHIAAFGVGTEPACWMQVRYPSGYASTFMGKMIIDREVECRSSGAERCRIAGRPTEQWDHPEEDLRYFAPTPGRPGSGGHWFRWSQTSAVDGTLSRKCGGLQATRRLPS
jgi:hypothetical protein